MEIKNKLRVTRGAGGGASWGKEGEPCTKDLWTRTMVWGLSLGAGIGPGNGGRGENGDNCN